MGQFYSDPKREADPYALPDCEVFELTATEAAELEHDTIAAYLRRPEFRLASLNNRVRERMLDAMVEEENIRGGWFYCYCQPGCLPDSDPVGPYSSEAEAIEAARDEAWDPYDNEA